MCHPKKCPSYWSQQAIIFGKWVKRLTKNAEKDKKIGEGASVA